MVMNTEDSHNKSIELHSRKKRKQLQDSEPRSKFIEVEFVSTTIKKFSRYHVYMVLLPSTEHGLIGVAHGHEKMVMLLDDGIVRCMDISGIVEAEYQISGNCTARIDGQHCIILSENVKISKNVKTHTSN